LEWLITCTSCAGRPHGEAGLPSKVFFPPSAFLTKSSRLHGGFSTEVYKGGSYVLCVHSDFPYYRPPCPAPNMITPKNDHSPERRCTCPPKVGGPNVGTEENCVVTMILSAQTSFVGMWPNPRPSDPPLLRRMFNVRIFFAAARRNRGRVAGLGSLL